ncbi:hypothetical protein EST38_g9716 [Candolleomyces aberdarensis]|uniref:Uncharacterized protein n=1 Tax=Candolleomyces aberdarensis TaxID=2316362 RepID=A0A4Q2D9X8_9AGAR|nr:hypothetical protein EST38_g9716 [Candolleomyces aberdarensis]
MNPCNATYHLMRLIPNVDDGTDDGRHRAASKDTQRTVRNLANVAWDLGLDIVLPRLISALTVRLKPSYLPEPALTFAQPFSTVYRTDDGRDARSYAEGASAVFLWMPAPRIFKSRLLPSVQYVVAFSVVCERPYHTVCLAYAIARFQDIYSVYGAFFYGHGLKCTYNKVLRQCQRGHANTAMYKKCPVTLWPSSLDIGVVDGSYDALLSRVTTTSIRHLSAMNFATRFTLHLHSHTEIDRSVDIERPSSSSVGGTHVSSPETGRGIVRLANTVWETGVEPIISQMAQLITVRGLVPRQRTVFPPLMIFNQPLSSVYSTVWTDAMKSHVTKKANFTFMITKVKTLQEEIEGLQAPEDAKFAVVFSIHTEPPFDSLALAYLLLDFPRRYYHEGKQRFFLVDLCYELGVGGVHGVLFYDVGLDLVHDNVIAKKVNDPEDLYHLDCVNRPHMVFSWNHDLVSIGVPDAIDRHFRDCLDIAKEMLEKMDF